MITTDLSKGQLTAILSALCGVQRNPASRADAIAAIEKQAKAIDLTSTISSPPPMACSTDG